MRALAVDPGGTTGLAAWDDGEWDATHRPWLDAQDHIEALVPYLDLLVCESFHISMQTAKKDPKGSLQAIELIGVCRFLARRAGIEFVTQSPSEAKTFSTDEKLKHYVWWNSSDHARDASRHLMLALAKRHIIDLKDLIT